MKWAFLTCPHMPQGTADDQKLLLMLKEQGVNIQFLPWQKLDSKYDMALVRTTWDYTHFYNDFISSIKEFKGRVINDPTVIEWNSHKGYLKELEGHGVDIIPMIDALDYQDEYEKCVVKPYISASAFQTKIFNKNFDEEILGWLKEGEKTHFVQPFCPSIQSHGEYSLIYFYHKDTCEFSHCCRKLPFEGDFRVQEEFGGSMEYWNPSKELVKAAELVNQVLLSKFCTDQLTFARLDFIFHENRWCLSEAELVEPDLYLRKAPESFTKFCHILKEISN